MSRKKGLSFNRKRKKISANVIREIWNYLFIIGATILVAFVIVYSVGMKTGNIGVSMEPTLYNGQQVLVNRFIYKVTSPQAGDIVVFLPGGNTNSHYYVKRIVAVPGDEVQIIDGVLYVNSIPYIGIELDKIADAGILKNALILDDDEYFVIGDNINSSEDSRSSNIGPIQKSDIIGKVWFHMGCSEMSMGFMQY